MSTCVGISDPSYLVSCVEKDSVGQHLSEMEEQGQ